MDEYDVISDDDLALIPRKASFSDCSSNGIVSQDSGHDSYLEEGEAVFKMFTMLATESHKTSYTRRL